MCKMTWGREIETTEAVRRLTSGRSDDAAIRAVFERAYGRYYTSCAVKTEAAQKAIASDIALFRRTEELPCYVLSLITNA